MRRIKIRVRQGRIEPVEPAVLPEGLEGFLTVPDQEEEEAEAPEAAGDIWAGYDPEKVKEALRESAGALVGVDRDALLRDIHAAREQESRGRHD